MNTSAPDLGSAVRDFLARFQIERAALAVAFSGGLDSTVLLHVLAQHLPADRLRALHVDHGLHPESAGWAHSCTAFCARIGVSCEVLRAHLQPSGGESIEAVAREARYRLFRGALRDAEWLVTAHHRQDQLETVLLALLRGSGVHGLAAMPPQTRRDGMPLLRPLLEVDRKDLRQYAEQHALDWIEDPSNTDERFDRNYLRLKVLPLLEARWPAAARAAGRSARHAADALHILDERADADCAGALSGLILDSRCLADLTERRRRNVVRRVCRRLELPLPTAPQLAEALAALGSSRPDAAPLAAWPGVRLRRYRDAWCFYSAAADPGAVTSEATLSWAAGERLALGWPRGELQWARAPGPGLRADLDRTTMEVRFRRGGEVIRPRRNGPARDFKKLLQEGSIFPWMRSHIPLIWVGGKLAAAGEGWLNFDHPDVVEANGLVPVWRGHEPLAAPF